MDADPINANKHANNQQRKDYKQKSEKKLYG